MNERRKALSLAAVLAATTLTGAAAVLGLTRNVPPAPSIAQPAVVQTTPPSVPQEEAD